MKLILKKKGCYFRKRNVVLFISFLFAFIAACSEETPPMEEEVFADSNRPFFKYDGSNDYFYCTPWNYELERNSDRKYPLVIYLHGWGGAGKIQSLNYLGYDSDDGQDDSLAKKIQEEHPCFVLVPQSYDDAWNGQEVAELSQNFIDQYRIDPNRIYLIGYSMGGSGSYIVANDFYKYNQHLFAGIVRLSGQSQTELRDEIALKTSVWFHIGLEDAPVRVEVTREAYNFLKAKHPTAVESSENISFNGVTGTTTTLTKNGTEIVKKTEYDGIGHGIDLFPSVDSSIIEWLFRQTLKE